MWHNGETTVYRLSSRGKRWVDKSNPVEYGGTVNGASQINRLEAQNRSEAATSEVESTPCYPEDVVSARGGFTSTRLNNGAKQRILGAAVLAALGVLFLPVLLQRPDMPTVDTRSQIPSMPESLKSASPEVTVVPAPAPQKTPDDVFSVEPISPAVTNPSTVVVGTSDRPARATSSVSRPATSTSTAVGGAPQGWVIQVASYVSESSAQGLVNRLLKKQFRAYSKAVNSAGKPRYRVYVGPYLQKEMAKKIKADIDQQLNVQSLLYKQR